MPQKGGFERTPRTPPAYGPDNSNRQLNKIALVMSDKMADMTKLGGKT